jgi:hypothetical protein
VSEERRRVLIVAFDGLRPDMATPGLMPNLAAFAQAGARFRHSRAALPTETRVNQATLVTGCYATRHGIVGNKFFDPVAAPGKPIISGDETQLAAADRRLRGKLLDVPALGEMLAAHGMNLAVIGTGTAGGTRVLHHKAERLGGFRLAMHRPDASVPADRIKAVIERIGPIPDFAIPALGWLTYATDVYLDYVEPELSPDVLIMWFCEPDDSYHNCGIGAEANLAALRHVDAEFGRILSWRDRSQIGDRLQIITMSDHGQLSVAHEALGLAGRLTAAGFAAGETVSDRADAALTSGDTAAIYVRDSEPARIRAIVDWLHAQPWCGPVITRDGRGTLSHAQLGIEHRRAPDIGLVLASDDAVNPHGLPGSCQHDSPYPVGGGVHGGLHPIELGNWLAAGGDAFRSGLESELPSGIVDVLPTVLDILGLEPPPSVQGRVLREALRGHAGEPVAPASQETFTAESADGLRTRLSISRVGATEYIERGWVERA